MTESNSTNGTPTAKALAMLSAFASVGARAFNKTILNIHGDEVKGLYRGNRNLDEMCRTIGRDLQDAERNRHSVVIRPLFKTPLLLIQLDDLDRPTVEKIKPLAFMVIRTSHGKDGTGNYQAWVALKDAPADKEAAKEFVRRVKKASAADGEASGSTRIAGSLNFKSAYAPEFPRVEITHSSAGHMTTIAALEQAGFVAVREQPRPPRPALAARTGHYRPKPPGWRQWPSYDMCLNGAPKGTSGKPKRSLADFTWCRTAIEWGWSKEATASHLMEISAKAKENGIAYAELTAERAAQSVERNPYRERSTPRPA